MGGDSLMTVSLLSVGADNCVSNPEANMYAAKHSREYFCERSFCVFRGTLAIRRSDRACRIFLYTPWLYHVTHRGATMRNSLRTDFSMLRELFSREQCSHRGKHRGKKESFAFIFCTFRRREENARGKFIQRFMR